ncbi:MAG: hypothetical protein IBX39_05000 [Candidatus Methanoperedenaceae archaeon]|nr:hypothetical protein [Candidatus Methanoperedenaceae archaeon]MDW7726601.1 hypothetical protein [Candidatus Methanoperedens sp.]
MDLITKFLLIVLIISFLTMYLMNIRIKQLRSELDDLRDRVTFTGEELMRLASDIEDFKRIQI